MSGSQGGFSGPPGLPGGVQKVLADALAKAIQNPEVAAKMQQAGSVLYYAPGSEFHAAAKAAYNLVTEYKDIFQEQKK